MLKKIHEDNSNDWKAAHDNNRKNKPKSVTQSFDNAVKGCGASYDPFSFEEQWKYIKRTFYKVQSGTNLVTKRRWDNGDPDDYIANPEVVATLERKYGAKLSPLIQLWAIQYIGTTAGERYNPATTEPFFEVENTRFRNSYRPSKIKQTAIITERPAIWQDYLDRLIPNSLTCETIHGLEIKQQDFFEAYICQRLQHPTKPPLICVLLRGEHGTGKNYWMDNILKPLLGDSNYIAATLSDVQKQFTKDLYSSLLVHIEEINDSRGKAGERLKKLITEERSRVEAKYINAVIAPKYFGIVASSNVADPVRIEQNDRRYFVPEYSTHQQDPKETKQFFTRLTSWLEEEQGLQTLANYFFSAALDSYDFRNPPATSAKDEIAEVQTTSEDNTTKAAMEIQIDYQDFVFPLTDVMSEWRIKQSEARKALTHAGFTNVKRRWVGGQQNPTSMWIHKSLVPPDGDWKNVRYSLFKKGFNHNPTGYGQDTELDEIDCVLTPKEHAEIKQLTQTKRKTHELNYAEN